MVNIYKLKFTLEQDVLRFLFMNPERAFTGRAIALRLKASMPGIKKTLPQLVKAGLIKVEKDKESKRLSIKLNREEKIALSLKRADNLKQIYESRLVDYLEENLPGTTIILFGSYSRGEDYSNSDIDIAVIGRKEKPLELADFEKKLERKITVNFYINPRDIHKNLKENIYRGITLVGDRK
ncbi:MAG: MarR family transcriptional regulator, partial [Nanoarchaeota archaeon]